ncbi:hypothetical protein ISS08_00155 [Candidatus Pacearchaeota archaeon]|nr:hypothetical protein [Candidatus Pacearchaeota archaeon]
MSFMDNVKKRIRATFILEIIGAPAEHLVKTLENIIGQIKKEKGIKLISSKINEPKVLEQRKDFFATFAEVEIEADEAMQISLLMFKYMPAHVEIISPENLSLTNHDLGEILSELARRLHSYDEMARVLQIQKENLEKTVKELTEKSEEKVAVKKKSKTPIKKK